MNDEVFNAGQFISRGRGIHPHRVIESDELIVVTRGVLEIEEERNAFRVEPGQWVLLHRLRRHGGLAAYGKNLVFFWLHFRDHSGWFERLPQHGKLRDGSGIVEDLRAFLAEQAEEEPDHTMQKLRFSLIFRELLRSARVESHHDAATPLLLAAERHISVHYREQISPEEIAHALHCNAKYLGRLFRARRGETMSSAINQHRLTKAAELLTGEEISIKEVAQLSGFNDPAYFRRKFRARFQETPGAYRRRFAIGHCNTE